MKNRWLSPTWRQATDAHAELRETLVRLMAERRRGGGDDVFSRLCRETESVGQKLPWLDDQGIARLMIGVLIGAFDTTSSGLASMAYLLAKHPDWQERLRNEASACEGSRASYADLKRLEETENVWKETLRLFPVSSHLPRYALRDVKLGQWHIPAGTFVWAMMGPLLADPAWWTDPHRFDPERFSAGRAEDKRHKAIFMPFGAGAHACLGMLLATIEVKAFWQVMLTRCRFQMEREYEGHHTYVPLGTVSGDVALKLERVIP